MFIPRKSKYKKAFKGRIRGNSKGGTSLLFGDYGLKALTSGKVTSKQLEATRRVISRTLKRAGKVWIRIFPDTPVTKKPADVRMGKGKGSVECWVFKVKPGRILFEVNDVPLYLAESALSKAVSKLPLKCKFISSHS
ncbi:50S ribosomal protein L16 [Wolbachia endosymbiont of Pentidionis agamae]|uniref:50S ribosomal protein L16 n=1 Tax=Wolbachia endosymbiont of Pentidionis agamae TaxID=3110435 RepID=UPI002FCF1940